MITLPTYSSRAAKESVFKACLFCDSESEVKAWLEEISAGDYGKGFAFRGVKLASYMLFTSLQREWITRSLKDRFTDHHLPVRELLNAARRMSAEYGGGVPQEIKCIEPEDELGLLSFLQHYECPTPLLDFTSDIRVALYFATERSSALAAPAYLDNYFSIYTFSEEIIALMNGGLEKSWHKHVETRFMDARRIFKSYKVIGAQDTLIFHPERHDKVYGKDIIPLWNSPRIQVQKGLFASNSTADVPFPEAVQAFVNRKTDNAVMRNSIKSWINSINIHRDYAPMVVEWLERQDPPMTKAHLLPVRPEHGRVKGLLEVVLNG